MAKKAKNKNKEPYKGNYPTVFKKVDLGDTKITPFNAYKRFTFLSGSENTSATALQGVYTNTLPLIGTELTYNDATNLDGSLQSVTYYSINHLYYKRKEEPSKTFGPTDLNRTHKFLYQTASVFVIPQVKIGEGIKPESFSYTGSTNLASDRYGNVYDVAFDTSLIISGTTFYEGFNEYFDTSRILYESHSGITYEDGVPTTDGSQLPIGKSAHFEGAGHFSAEIPGYYNRDEDYAISFFVSGSVDTATNLILAKASSATQTQFPFKIELSGSNELIFSAGATSNLLGQVTSSVAADNWTHVVCQKTGSVLELYVDTVLQQQISYGFLNSTFTHPTASAGYIHNKSEVNFGGYSPIASNLTGDLDEVRIFNQALGTSDIGALSDRTEGGTFLQTNNVGTIYDKHGTIVISSPNYRYQDIITAPYTASYRSTITINEFSSIVKIDAGDFNMSTNPSLTKDNGVDYKDYVSGSNFGPYITTIGLYNPEGQLLAVGKLASPLQKRNDVDTNILLRIDLDG